MTTYRPLCVACGAPWHAELLLHGDEAWVAARLADLAVPVDRARLGMAHERSGIEAVQQELGKQYTPEAVVRWEFVLCVAHWPDGDPWQDVADVNRWARGVELFQLG